MSGKQWENMERNMPGQCKLSIIFLSKRFYTQILLKNLKFFRVKTHQKQEQYINNKYQNSNNEAEKQELLKNNSSSYKQASETAQDWGMGGDKSRAVNAVVINGRLSSHFLF